MYLYWVNSIKIVFVGVQETAIELFIILENYALDVEASSQE